MTMTRLSVLVSVALALMVSAGSAYAQGLDRIRIALVESLSTPDARAEILRLPGAGASDVILLAADRANPIDLAAALELHRRRVRGAPKMAGLLGRTTITSLRGSERLSSGQIREAADMLRSVQLVGEARIGNLGRGRWKEFDVTR